MSNLKKGRFRAKAVEHALGKSKGGKERVAVRLQILDESCLGETITWRGYFTDAAIDRTFESLRHLGWTSDDVFKLDGLGSTEASVVLDEETYEGKTHLRVKWINAGNAGLALKAPMSEDEGRSFADRMKGRVAAHKAASGSRSNGHQQDDAPPHSDQDYGF